MADIVDRAQAREEEMRQDALSRARRKSPGPRRARIRCEDCGASIPPARLVALPDCSTCIDCQAWRERLAKGRERTGG